MDNIVLVPRYNHRPSRLTMLLWACGPTLIRWINSPLSALTTSIPLSSPEYHQPVGT
jgi:hypothetical protein